MMLWFMSSCHNKDILNNVILAFKMSLLSKRHLMTVVINFIFKTYVLCTPIQVKCYQSF